MNAHKRVINWFHEANCPYSVKNLKFHTWLNGDEKDIVFFLNRMDNNLESLKIGTTKFRPAQPEDLFVCPMISNIPFIKIGSIENNDTVEKLAQIWIEKDAKIGNKFQVLVLQSGSFESFSQHFEDRLVTMSYQFIRIKTENPSKHVLLQIGYANFERLDGPDCEEFLQMTIIPSELTKIDASEEWIRNWSA